MPAVPTLTDLGVPSAPYGTSLASVPDGTVALQNVLNTTREWKYDPDRDYKVTASVISRMVPKIIGVGSSARIRSTVPYPIIFRNPGVDIMTYKTKGVLENISIEAPGPCIQFDLTGGTQGVDYFDSWEFNGDEFLNLNTTGLFHAVELVNPTVGDGFFLCKFDSCWMQGGFKMQRLGDSVIFKGGAVFGLGDAFDFDAVQGAVHAKIEDYNLSTTGYALIARDYVQHLHFLDNNVENANGSSQPNMISLRGTSGKTVKHTIIKGGSFNGLSHVTGGIIDIAFADDTLIDENAFLGASTAISIASTANRTRIGQRNLNSCTNFAADSSTSTIYESSTPTPEPTPEPTPQPTQPPGGFPYIFGTPLVTKESADTTTHHVNVQKSDAAIGDRIVLIMGIDGGPVASGFPTGWAEVGAGNTSIKEDVWEYKIPDQAALDALTASFTYTTSASERSLNRSHIWRGSDLTQPIAAGAPTGGTGTAPNPPAITIPWGVANTAFIAIACTPMTATVYPTGYDDNHYTDNCGGTTTADSGLSIATRNFTGTSDDPAPFTTGSSAWVTLTLAIKGA